ncbi:MAG TPA: SMC-Scp complex subunit ScpB [Kofleriaceae bacterium]|nr:SMC-Scp complex subunit ScpB [Kofleriaceae bacterium]
MSRKRGKKQKPAVAVEAIPDDILAEGSGPVRRVAADAITTVEDVVTTTDEIATTEDVVTADDVVATAEPEAPPSDEDGPSGAPGPAHASAGAGANGEEDGEDDRERADDDAAGRARGVKARSAGRRRRESRAEAKAESSGGSNAASLDESNAASLDESNGASLDAEGASTLGDLSAAGEAGDATEAGEAGDVSEAGEAGDGDEEDAASVFPTSAATMDAVQLKHLVEALIFASDRPLTVQRLRQLTRVGDVRRLEQALADLMEEYRERGLILQQVSGGYQFRTRTQFSAWVQQLIAGRPVRLSRAQLETLAIIAYRQPITRPEIDDIRGVDSSATLKLLIDRMLIRVLGKREEVGRPMLYGTTKEFLDFFSLGDLRELPTLREYSELTAESRKVMSDRLGLDPDGSDDPTGSGGEGDGGPSGSGGEGGGGGGGGEGGPGGGGLPPGFDDEDGTTPDTRPRASAGTTAAEDALATFLAAADAVERSSAAAIADLEAPEPASDEPGAGETEPEEPGDEAPEPAGAAPHDHAGHRVARGVDSAGHAVAGGDTAEDLASEDLVDAPTAAPRSVDDPERLAWPSGSQRFAVIASSDDPPVEPPAMETSAIPASAFEASALDDCRGEAASAGASHVDPAAE